MLTPEQLKAREGKLTASAVGALMSGDDAKVLNLWRRLVGDPDYVDDDLSGVWPVQLGNATEALNLDWYERKSGHILTRKGEVVVHPRFDWAAATLDGWVEALMCPIECKHVGGREPFDRIRERYTPQMMWQMSVTGAEQCIFSVIEGANAPRIEAMDRDGEYIEIMWDRAQNFMRCVRNMTPPVQLEAFDAPPPPAVREVDFTGSNEWADHAITWLGNNSAALKAEKAEKALKGMMPEDAKKASGHGIAITRDKARRLTLKAA